MKKAISSDAVGYFSENAAEFHQLYAGDCGFAERFALWSEILDRVVEPGALALDMGCGAGIFSFYMARKGANVVGIDAAEGMITFCDARRQELGILSPRFVQGRLPELDETGLAGASLLISSSVIEYVDDLEGVIAVFARLLKPRGTMVLSMPNRSSLSRTFQRLKFSLTGEPDVYRYIRHFSSPRALARLTKRFGFELRESHYYGHTTRLAELAHKLRLPSPLCDDLFVVVLQRG
jgi:2-polyprenyl-3-methyl-5-hydroxy-6-metoxy-1,4-benzoquinol methylase